MARSISEQVTYPIQRYTKKEAKAYDDIEINEATMDSKPMDGEPYLLLTPNGTRIVTYITYGAETVTRKRTKQKAVKNP